MSDGTSSEASYEYEYESQHWDFGDDDYYEDVNRDEDVRTQFETRSSFHVSEAREISTSSPQLPNRSPQDAEVIPHTEGLQLRNITGNDGVARIEDDEPHVHDNHNGDNGERIQSDRVEQVITNQVELNVNSETQEVDADQDELDDVHDHNHSTVIHLNGFRYTRSHQSQWNISYRCSFYRRTLCRGKVQHDIRTATYTNWVVHSSQSSVVAPATYVDVLRQMESETDHLATTQQSLTAQQIWDLCGDDDPGCYKPSFCSCGLHAND
ncbi:hypothetical protein PHPALM_28243 [Phytophthora palmivora]|uniref:FLYWCH-type domain-containing protein n=1 Tax=Phytophthora palmivora TaxID=4796 RepID=A0A2P4XAK1_9STRA|nr:hypothetical protein PHPALM_28243 [Phytophthora palmivora]